MISNMRKIILSVFIIFILFFSGCESAYKEQNKTSEVHNQSEVYDMLKLDSYNKNNKKDIVYVAIFDTGIDETYAQSFYQSEYSCISKIMSYANNSIYATESRHGTLMQQFFDEMSIRAGTIDTIKTIHFKVKESDNEKVSLERVIGMMNQVLKLKQEGYNITVLNISQIFEGDNESAREIELMIHTLFENGIITVSAAGNICDFDVQNNIFAKSDDSIVVGGIDLNNKRWISDNKEGSPLGNRIDIYSYASDIVLGEKVPYYSETVSGTSYSTIIISWHIANYINLYESIDINQLRDKIKNAIIINDGLKIFDVNQLYKRR